MSRTLVTLFLLMLSVLFYTERNPANAEQVNFWDKFEKKTYRSDEEVILKIDDPYIPLKIIGSENTAIIENTIEQTSLALKSKITIASELEQFLVIFSNDFYHSVRFQFGGYFLSKFPHAYRHRNIQSIMEKAYTSGCFYFSALVSVNKGPEKVHTALFVNNELPLDVQQKCIFYNFLKLGGLSNINFGQIDEFIVEKNGKLVLSDFTYQALSLISKSGPAERQSKAKMKKFVEVNYPVSRELNK